MVELTMQSYVTLQQLKNYISKENCAHGRYQIIFLKIAIYKAIIFQSNGYQFAGAAFPDHLIAMFSKKDLLFSLPESSILEQLNGGYAKRILVLLRKEAEYPENIAFLKKILTAAQIDLEKDTLWGELNAPGQFSLLPALKEKHPESILVFGIPAPQLGIRAEIPFYQPFYFYGTHFIFSENLSLLEPDKTRKGNLWRALQQLYLK